MQVYFHLVTATGERHGKAIQDSRSSVYQPTLSPIVNIYLAICLPTQAERKEEKPQLFIFTLHNF